MPSDAMIRSASGKSRSESTSVSNCSTTPSSSQRRCRMLSRCLRPMPMKPCPPERMVRPLKCSSMSSQCANASSIERRRLRVAALHVGVRGVGEDHAPSEGVVGLVALDDGDLVRRVRLLHEEGEVESGGSAADAGDVHGGGAGAGRGWSGWWGSVGGGALGVKLLWHCGLGGGLFDSGRCGGRGATPTRRLCSGGLVCYRLADRYCKDWRYGIVWSGEMVLYRVAEWYCMSPCPSQTRAR